MNVLFVYPEHYLNIGIPGGITALSANLKRHGHRTALVDTTFMKTDPEFDSRTFDSRALHQKVHGGLGEKEADRSGVSPMMRTSYTIEDLVKDDPVVSYEEEFQKAIDSFNPDLIAISTMTSTFDFCLDLLRVARYDCKVIVGGIHPTIAVGDCLAQKEIDMAAIGESDETFVELCDLMEAGKDYANVRGIVFKLADGTIKHNPPALRVDNDELPCPDWGLFDRRHLYRPFEGQVYQGSFYAQSRGCPMKCTYCVDPTVAESTGGSAGYFRQQKVSVTISHLTHLKEEFGVSWVKFADDSFLLPRVDRLEELGDGLKRLGIKFGCSVMPNTITEEKVKLAREMGCVAMSVGVESGNEGIRRQVRRNYRDDQLVERLKIVQEYGIRLSTFNIIGFPGETRDNVFETIRLNRRIGTSACNVYILFPYPGTPIQIEQQIPIRGADGRILPVSMAKELRLSKMSPDELEGLQHTFNYYLHLPEELWPIVELAERHDERGMALRRILHQYVVSYLSKTAIATTSLESVLAARGYLDGLKDQVRVPAILCEVFSLPLSDAHVGIVTDALRAYGRAAGAPASDVAPVPLEAESGADGPDGIDRKVIPLQLAR
ncbi:MAG: hypothetical protein A3I61_20005 [Acidobacteria bacterium RIFCSPLOWO2_02_FULL_68_18]|nr:MAG: hypothetical protein A3I61_20005 [Acidobacteria bacterium RIFCSPLOWO2_02_FULL_68_18]OFW48252.1 MAG: hypothetical protein A3G77_03135 [Acidobacteria bacterium RIFCSPLOWO2_12_FULL_68_19]